MIFERIVARLQARESGRWVLKGGMALEVRLGGGARLTKDLDLGLRDEVPDPADLHECLVGALSVDPDGDYLVLTVGPPVQLREDGGGHVTWRVSVSTYMADKPFGRIRLDISPRAYELDMTEKVTLPNSLDFAGIPIREFEIIDVNRHAAEKFHAMLRDFGNRENSRVRDLIDLVILADHDLLTVATVADTVKRVWAERDGSAPPNALPPLPSPGPSATNNSRRITICVPRHTPLQSPPWPGCGARCSRASRPDHHHGPPGEALLPAATARRKIAHFRAEMGDFASARRVNS
ncbi:nucleotidyl transferase AbiEii/AbiGii toxin family protein [Mycobacterium malmoense]|uniref:nucleotidyl transferase AbiEii/AbiGii toxin family protein n=1 Tax=Mycobacterium malmoense TaxID=1780 RepID=UPI001E3E6AB6|nr:nucleotidyl transferase AbiEii/AbiGii toxin family protein [Mycobacterium malmoense]